MGSKTLRKIGVTEMVLLGVAALSCCAFGTPSSDDTRKEAGIMSKSNEAKVSVQPAPAGEPVSDEYAVVVGGTALPVYPCRVSAAPINQMWPGYQRPLDQTEIAAFAYCDCAGPASVQVTPKVKIESVVIRPLSRNITPAIKDGRISFKVSGPGPLTVEVNGWHNALHLFISPPAAAAPSADDPNVRYFGPGVHHPGKIVLKSNETVYVAAGAVVYGCFAAQQASNIKILGRGIVDVSEFERGKGGGAIRLSDCTDITIDGLVLRDPDVLDLHPAGLSPCGDRQPEAGGAVALQLRRD